MANVLTGLYMGAGTVFTRVVTGLTNIKVVRVTEVPDRGGRTDIAYSTDAMQRDLGSGVFVNGGRKDTGLTLEGGSFLVDNADFNASGRKYFWEAAGD